MSARLPEPVVGPIERLFAALPVTIRPMRADDGALLDAFVRGLSPGTRYRRFHGAVNALAAPLIARFTNIDEQVEMALLATTSVGSREVAIAEARYGAADSSQAREFALAVAERWQRVGLGTRLLRELMRHAGQAGMNRIVGDTFADNAPMLALARRLGFTQRRHPTDARLVRLSRALNESPHYLLPLLRTEATLRT